MDYSLPSSSVHGLSQGRMLERVAISFPRRSSLPRDQTHVSCIGRQVLYHWVTWETQSTHTAKCGGGGLVTKSCPTLATPWTVASQAPLPIEFSRQEYWSGLSFPSPGDLPNPGIKPRPPALQEDSLPSESPGETLPEIKSQLWTAGCITFSNLLYLSIPSSHLKKESNKGTYL